MIKHIAFDCFGVLINIKGHFFDSVCTSVGLKMKDYKQAYEKYENEFQKGNISESELWEIVFEINTDYSYWEKAFTELSEKSLDTVKLFKDLANNKSVGIFSNIEIPLIPCVESLLSTNTESIFKFYSCYEQIRKPEIEAFDKYSDYVSVPKNEILFIDDNMENVDSAIRAGFKAHHYIGYDFLRAELDEFGII